MKAIRLVSDIVASDGAPVVLKGAIGVYSPDGGAVVFNAAITAGSSPVFAASFVDGLSDKTEPLSETEVPPEMRSFDFSGHIPILGWGLR